jgi:hypothetical protein
VVLRLQNLKVIIDFDFSILTGGFKMFYKVFSDLTTEDKLFISKQFAIDHNINRNDNVTFQVATGQRKCTCEVIILEDLEDDTVKLSKGLIDCLYIPENIKFQIIVRDNKIHIGPIIGLLFKKSINKLNKSHLKGCLKYTLKYSQINGLLCVFTSDSINFDDNTVEGFYYNPQNRKWVRASLPIPDSIFRKAPMPQNICYKLSKTTGNKLFNSYFFNKWEFWKTGLKYDIIKDHIPYTEKMISAERVVKLLEEYNFLYLKPISGTFSRGIVRLEKQNENYLAKTNERIKPLLFANKEELFNYLLELKSRKSYLVQQGIDVVKLTGGYTSLRVIMQKNQELNWQCTGIISRVGEARGISSNFNSWGYGLTLEDFLVKSHNLTESEISNKRQEVIMICKSVCAMIDKTWGNYGDVGIDIGIDNNLGVWIFEVNKTHMHYIPLKINDYKMYYEVKTMPIKYAAVLSGFKVKEG